MKKKWLVLWGLLLCLMVGMTGCNRELTLEEILVEMQEFNDKSDVMVGNVKVEVDGVISVEGMEMDIAMSSDVLMESQKLESESITHMKGKTQEEIMGEAQTDEQESFVVTKDGLEKKYDCIEGVWIYREEEEQDTPDLLDSLNEEGSEWVLAEEHVDKNGVECYELKATFSGKALENFGGMFETEEEAIDLSSAKMDATLYVSVKDCSLREVYMDMSSVMAQIMGMTDEEVEVETEFETCYMQISDIVYDTELNLQVPEEALKAETVKGIMDQVEAAVLEEGTLNCELSMEIVGEITAEGQTMDMDMLVDAKYQIQSAEDSQKMYMLMDNEVSMMGQSQVVTTETYSVQEGDTVRLYTPVEGQWYYVEQPVDEATEDMAAMIEDIYSESMAWTLVNENADLNGVSCYELNAALQGDAIQSVLQMTSEMGVGDTGMDYTDSELRANLYISKDSYQILEMSMDAKEIMEATFEGMGLACSFEACTIAIKNISYTTEEVVIPQAVLAAQPISLEEETGVAGEADAAKLAEITEAGEFVMQMEDWPEKIRVEWPEEYECVYAVDQDLMQIATYYDYVEYDFYPNDLYESLEMDLYVDNVIEQYKADTETAKDLQVSDWETIEMEDGTCKYRSVSFLYEGMYPNTCYFAWVKMGNTYLLISTDFMSEGDMQERFEAIVEGISLVK